MRGGFWLGRWTSKSYIIIGVRELDFSKGGKREGKGSGKKEGECSGKNEGKGKGKSEGEGEGKG